jgi:hypothetical protein
MGEELVVGATVSAIFWATWSMTVLLLLTMPVVFPVVGSVVKALATAGSCLTVGFWRAVSTFCRRVAAATCLAAAFMAACFSAWLSLLLPFTILAIRLAAAAALTSGVSDLVAANLRISKVILGLLIKVAVATMVPVKKMATIDERMVCL